MGKNTLKRKVLVVEEKQGSQEADYSIRVLQSKNVLRLAVPSKDPHTGKVKTTVTEVEGPVAVIETTTRTGLNPENASRCFIVYLDESEEQTRKIHDYQKLNKTVLGIKEKDERERVIRKHQNMQRLLKKVFVDIPYVEHVKFPTKWIRSRRDHMRFLSLIEASAFLHQYQREKKTTPEGLEYIEASIDDYRTAYSLAKDVIGDALTDLAKPEREFYSRLERMAEEKRVKKFTRREIRAFTGCTDHLARKTLKTLTEMEYVLVTGGRNGIKYEYMLNPYHRECKEIIQGLLAPAELKRLIKEDTLRTPCESVNPV